MRYLIRLFLVALTMMFVVTSMGCASTGEHGKNGGFVDRIGKGTTRFQCNPDGSVEATTHQTPNVVSIVFGPRVPNEGSLKRRCIEEMLARGTIAVDQARALLLVSQTGLYADVVVTETTETGPEGSLKLVKTTTIKGRDVFDSRAIEAAAEHAATLAPDRHKYSSSHQGDYYGSFSVGFDAFVAKEEAAKRRHRRY